MSERKRGPKASLPDHASLGRGPPTAVDPTRLALPELRVDPRRTPDSIFLSMPENLSFAERRKRLPDTPPSFAVVADGVGQSALWHSDREEGWKVTPRILASPNSLCTFSAAPHPSSTVFVSETVVINNLHAFQNTNTRPITHSSRTLNTLGSPACQSPVTLSASI